MVEIHDINEPYTERDQALRERAVQKALSTLFREDKYRFKVSDQRAGETQNTIRKKDSQESLYVGFKTTGQQHLNIVVRESEKGSPRPASKLDNKV